MEIFQVKLTFRWYLLGLSIFITLVLGFILIFHAYSRSTKIDERVNLKKEELLRKTVEVSDRIDKLLFKYRLEADSLSEKISKEEISFDHATILARKLVEQEEILFSIAFAYRPFFFGEDQKYVSAVITKSKDGIKKKRIEDSYPYDDANTSKSLWYRSTIESGSQWIDPFYAGASKNLVFGYATTFKVNNAKVPDGVVIFTFSIDCFSNYLKSMDLGQSGYSAIVSHTGKYLVHPEDDYIIEKKTIYEIGLEKHDKERLKWWKVRDQKPKGAWNHRSTTTGENSFFIFAPMRQTGFHLHNTFLKKDVIFDYDLMRRGNIYNILFYIVFMFFVIATYLLYRGVCHINFWVSTSIFSILMLFSIGYVWSSAIRFHPERNLASNYITNKSVRTFHENLIVKKLQSHSEIESYSIPTGIYIDEIKFKGINDITLVGTVWQKFDREKHKKIPKEIAFPSAEVISISDPPKVASYKNYDLYRWRFKVEISQNFDYLSYPLNYEKIELEIQQRESDHEFSYVKSIPTPDIMAYKLTTPTSKMGLRKDISIPGWDIMESSFSIHTESLDADFGNGTTITNNVFPTISFGIGIKRKFLDVFISNLTPLILVLSLLFLGLTISNVSERYVALFKPDLPKMIGFYSGLLFIVAFAHIGVREKVNAEGLFLLEYFYLIAYMAFMYVTINTILYRAKVCSFLVQYESNLVYKVLFWPLILISILTVSVLIFY